MLMSNLNPLHATSTTSAARSSLSAVRFLLLLTLLPHILLITSSQAADIDPKQPIRVCGGRLIKLLRAVCQHGIATPKQNNGARTGSQRGIADSCCVRSCTIEHIQTYCRAPPVLMRRTGDSYSDRVAKVKSQLQQHVDTDPLHYRHHYHHHGRAVHLKPSVRHHNKSNKSSAPRGHVSRSSIYQLLGKNRSDTHVRK